MQQHEFSFQFALTLAKAHQRKSADPQVKPPPIASSIKRSLV
jgi:hypothetical protein